MTFAVAADQVGIDLADHGRNAKRQMTLIEVLQIL